MEQKQAQQDPDTGHYQVEDREQPSERIFQAQEQKKQCCLIDASTPAGALQAAGVSFMVTLVLAAATYGSVQGALYTKRIFHPMEALLFGWGAILGGLYTAGFMLATVGYTAKAAYLKRVDVSKGKAQTDAGEAKDQLLASTEEQRQSGAESNTSASSTSGESDMPRKIGIVVCTSLFASFLAVYIIARLSTFDGKPSDENYHAKLQLHHDIKNNQEVMGIVGMVLMGLMLTCLLSSCSSRPTETEEKGESQSALLR